MPTTLNLNSYPDTATRIVLNKALQTLEVFRSVDPTMPLGEAVSLLTIALGQSPDGSGLTVTDVVMRIGRVISTTGRYVQSLAGVNSKGEPGREFITNTQDPTDYRRVVCRLTPKGVWFLNKIHTILG